MIVDDDEEFVEATSLFLENSGYEVASDLDGRAAVERARDTEPNLILLNVMMSSRTEGFEILDTLRTDGTTSSIPVMMLTAVGKQFAGAELASGQLPTEAFVEKPVKPGELLNAIEKLLKD